MIIDFDPNILTIGALEVTWYGLLFAMGFGISRFIVKHIFKKEGRWKAKSDILLVYMIVGTVIGARLGHVFFYEPAYYFYNPIEVLKIWEGGLSSHGTSVGILIAVALYCYHWSLTQRKFVRSQREGYSYHQVIDRMVIVVAFGAIFIRTGNFLNAEAIGKPTQSKLGVFHTLPINRDLITHLGSIESIEALNNSTDTLTLLVHFPPRIQNKDVIDRYNEFVIKKRLHHMAKGINAPIQNTVSSEVQMYNDHYVIETVVVPIYRHPAQLYEALSYLLLFITIITYWNRYKLKSVPGRIFGIFLLILFGTRIVWENFKVESSAINDGFLTMGQLLSLPFFVYGLFLILNVKKSPSKTELL